MYHLYSGHSDENIIYHIVPILRNWGIASRLGYIMTDNEPANGTTVNHILEVLEPEIYQSIKTKKSKRLNFQSAGFAALPAQSTLSARRFY